MPRPQRQMINFSIDGLEVEAPENIMLVDAAKYGDVEIPVFCYEPKLGAPVGACRMCLVEIEGIPKLQTACSTPVKDGMVVHTQAPRVGEAQQAVVEFLLVNHPLDCPVCDKGGECPLQDITYGWGGGRSRFIEPKRHFRKPLELSPLIAIDRERCILCYRCVRFSQEISEDYQLILLERGAHSFVGTFDGHPYVAPFSGNIVELCPVGALTSRPYRFRARPWDIEGAGSVCTFCPAQCNATLTVRDERVVRVLARDHEGVDDGWLCDKGRFGYQSFNVDERVLEPMVRDGGELRPVPWERALDAAAAALGRAGAHSAALAGGGATNEEGLLLGRLLRDALGSGHLDSRPHGAVELEALRRLSAPNLAASVADLEFAETVLVLDCEPLDAAPVLDLRIRKGVRRNGVQLLLASSRPSALDAIATQTLRGGELAARLAAGDAPENFMGALRAKKEVVIVHGERADAGGVLALADALGLAGQSGAGLIGLPESANGRGLREAGVLPNAEPGLTDARQPGRDAAGIAAGLADGALAALYLLQCDPLRTYPDRGAWEAALEGATSVIAHSAFLTEGVREHATVVFPAEVYAEKDGTVTHPDGRVQRLRAAVGRAGEVRAEWRVLSELARRLGHDWGLEQASACSRELFEAVPFYRGLTLEELGGRGVRWPERDAASALRAAPGAPAQPRAATTPAGDGRLVLGTYRPVWAAPEVEASPALHFLVPEQQLEIAPADARRLGVGHGDWVLVTGEHGGRVRARAVLRDAVPAGSVFLAEGLRENSASAIAGELVQVHRAESGNGAAPVAVSSGVEA
jgi:NADH-quinone oxidoreductase subunit G